MQIYVINLAEKTGRWSRMAGLLQGLPFHRIAAVDGQTIDGPETNIRTPKKLLSRYHQACLLSHRAAYQAFLAGPDRYGCVLEDDVFISPDFPRFINNEDWIPPGCDVIKIETTQAFVWFTGRRMHVWTGRPRSCVPSIWEPALTSSAAGRRKSCWSCPRAWWIARSTVWFLARRDAKDCIRYTS